jgi:hypothetical protein
MPLETITGPDAYVDDLNPDWPLGPDDASGGDNHIRGIKNVLLNTLPNVSGPITRTHTQLSVGSVPSGSILPFYNATAPTGWTRTVGIDNTFMLRVVATASAGGGSGGAHDPVVNDKIPWHVHGYGGTTSGEDVDHAHYLNAETGAESATHEHYVSGNTGVENAPHNHNMGGQVISGGGRIQSGGSYGGVDGITTTGTENQQHIHGFAAWSGGINRNHIHGVSAWTGGRNTGHVHGVSGSTAANANSSNWTPRYLNVGLCTKD